VPSAGEDEERRGPGRPRKWVNEAERVRAYRQRKAEEHASADGLRVERRVLKRQLSDALRGRTRAEAALDHATTRIEALEAELERTRAKSRKVEADLGSARSKMRELLEKHDPAALVTTREPGLGREQRRAMERNKRKRGH
jgi:predicted  nucleic acid-binding Zn-ribbon protein